jgi:hypothetical protein
MNNFTDIDKNSRSQIGKEVTIEENVCVRKSLVSDGGSRLRFEYTLESDHAIPLEVQIREPLPSKANAANLGFHKKDEGEHWQMVDDHLVFNRTIQPGDSLIAGYSVDIAAGEMQQFPDPPVANVVTPTGHRDIEDKDNTLLRESNSNNNTTKNTAAQVTNTDDRAVHANGEQAVAQHISSELLLDRDSEMAPALSIVMPTLNEQKGIAECIEKTKRAIEQLGVTAEIIISDSSTDRTPEIAREHGAIVVEPDKKGYGYAYRYAFQHARGEYIAIGDADTTYDFEDLPRLLKLVSQGDADMAMGSRLNGEIKSGAMPRLHQHIGNPLLTKFLNLFYDAGVVDAHSGLRVISREALDQLELKCNGMEFASEMIMAAGAKGLTVEEVPITYHEREGEATLSSFRDGWRHIKFMLLNAPSYLFSIPAIGIGLLGMVVMMVSLLEMSVGGIYFGIHTVVASSLLVISSYQIGGLALISAVAADPIRKQRGPVIQWIRRNIYLEHALTFGLLLLLTGGGYVTSVVINWIASGYVTPPFKPMHMVGFTAIALGLQTMFSALLLSMLHQQRKSDGRTSFEQPGSKRSVEPNSGD